MELVEAALGMEQDQIPALVQEFIGFSISQGGLGLGITETTKHAAFAASFLHTSKTIQKMLPTQDIARDSLIKETPYLSDAMESLAYVATHGSFNQDQMHQQIANENENTGGSTYKLQHTYTQAINEIRCNATYEAIPDSKTKAWMISHRLPESNLWLDAIPKFASLIILTDAFMRALRFKLYLPQPHIAYGMQCNCPAHPQLDSLGHHLATGCSTGGTRQNTHDSIKRTISRILASLAIPNKLEEKGVFQETNPNCQMRPDISIPANMVSTKKTIIDIAVTNPIPGAQSRTQLTMAQAAVPGRAAEKRYQEKMHKYLQIADANNLQFIPMIFECSGYVHEVTIKWFKSIIKQTHSLTRYDEIVMYRYTMTSISVSLQKALMEGLKKRITEIHSKSTLYSNYEHEYEQISAFNSIHVRAAL